MQRAGVHPVKRFYRSVPQVLTLDQECTGNPVTKRWDVPTDEFVQCEGSMHRQFNSMYVVTLKVAKDCKTLTSGPKFAGMANFGDVRLSKSKNKGGGAGGGARGGDGGGGGGGGGNQAPIHPPPKKVEDEENGEDNDDNEDDESDNE